MAECSFLKKLPAVMVFCYRWLVTYILSQLIAGGEQTSGDSNHPIKRVPYKI